MSDYIERLTDAISGERADWFRVEVDPRDIAAALAARPDSPTLDVERLEKNYKSLRVAAQRVLDDWNRVGAQGDGYRALRAALAAEADRAETRTIAARIERDARFRDALDALDLATLWLHRTMDLPHRDSQQAASWERKARSGRAALREQER